MYTYFYISSFLVVICYLGDAALKFSSVIRGNTSNFVMLYDSRPLSLSNLKKFCFGSSGEIVDKGKIRSSRQISPSPPPSIPIAEQGCNTPGMAS